MSSFSPLSRIVYPEYRTFRMGAPTALAIGVAREQVFARYASGRLDLQAFVGQGAAIGVRVAAGVSFGVGRYK